MSNRTTDTDADSAIERSRANNECVTIEVETNAERERVVTALRAVDCADGVEIDWVENGNVTEVWAYDADLDDDSMEWRVHVEVRA